MPNILNVLKLIPKIKFMWHVIIDLYIVITCRLADFPCMVREVEVGFAHVDGQST